MEHAGQSLEISVSNLRPGFVIGNGRSRVGLDLRRLNTAGVTYGSNAIMRDAWVNNIVCCDRVMLGEATGHHIEKKTNIYTRARWLQDNQDPNLRVVPDLPYLGPNKADQAQHWGSGHYSALLACTAGHEVIIYVGFDLYGNAKGKQNNVYSDTNGYKAKTEDAVDPKFWIYHSAKLFEHFPDTQHVYINTPTWEVPEEWKQYPNFSSDNYEGLDNFLVDYNV